MVRISCDCIILFEAKLFKFKVSSVDATKVKCSGEGLRQGVVGREIKSWIDTRRAGPGELTAHCKFSYKLWIKAKNFFCIKF